VAVTVGPLARAGVPEAGHRNRHHRPTS
jgi:hypothetical protein